MACTINVCTGSSCGGKGGTSLVRDIEDICQGRAQVEPGQCLGKCANGPNVEVVSGGSKEITTKVNNFKKAVELVKNQDIDVRSIISKVGKVTFAARREESGEVRQKKIEEAIALVGGEEKGKSKEPIIMSELFVLRSKEMIKARKYPEAVQDAEKALELNPEWPQALLAHATALETVGRNGDAVAAIEKALKINKGIGAEKSSVIRLKARIDRKVAENGPIGPGAAAPAPAAAAPPDAAAKPKAKPKAKKKDPEGDAPPEKKGGTKAQGDKKSSKAKTPGADGKDAPKTSTKTKPEAAKADVGASDIKEAPAPGPAAEEVDLGDMPHQVWKLNAVKQLTHDCISLLFICPRIIPLARYPAAGDVWHVDVLAEIDGGELMRAYTPVSSQDDYFRGSLELMVKVYPDGKMTQHLSKLAPRDDILISAPLSTFVPQDYAEGMTLVAGGTAVTLALQACNAVLRLSQPGTSAAPPLHAFICNRTGADALYQDRFDELQATYPSLRVVHCLSQGDLPENKPGRAEWYKGRIDAKILSTAEASSKSVVSGPPGLCGTTVRLLTKLGRSRESVDVMDDLPEGEEVAEEEEQAEPAPPAAEFPIKAWCEVGPNGKPCGGGAEKSSCSGVVHLEQVDAETCKISYKIKGLAPGKHGFHIHESSDFSNGCISAGPHYNPHGRRHGGPQDAERHVGDLGNIEPSADGVAEGELVDSLIKLYGEFSVLGRSFMVHADPDDLGRGDHSEPGTNGKTSQTTGNAGARIACGEIAAGEYAPPRALPMTFSPMQCTAPAPAPAPDVATPAAAQLAGHVALPARAAAADIQPPSDRPTSWLSCGLFGACRPARKRAPSPDCGDEAAVAVD